MRAHWWDGRAARVDALRVEAKFARRINVIWVVQPLARKYSPFVPAQISASMRHPTRQEGRLAIVTNVRWDAVDARAATDERGSNVRQSRVVLTPEAGVKFSRSKLLGGDGGNRARLTEESAI